MCPPALGQVPAAARRQANCLPLPACRPPCPRSNVANTSITSLAPPKTQAQAQKEALAAAARSLKSQIAGRAGGSALHPTGAAGADAGAGARPPSAAAAAVAGGARREVKTLDEYLAGRSASSSALDRAASSASSSSAALAPAPTPSSAWGRSRASSVGSLGDAALGAPVLGSDDAFPPPGGGSGGSAGRPPLPPRAGSASAFTGPMPAAAPGPQGAWALRPGESSAASMASSLASGVPPAGAGAGAAAGAGAVPFADTSKSIPGLDGPEKLTKAQRKNLRRAERKHQKEEGEAAAAAAAQVAAEAATHPADAASSVCSPEAAAAAVAEPASAFEALGAGPAGMLDADDLGPAASASASAAMAAYECCIQLLAQHKLQSLVEELQRFGFPALACVAAVRTHGGNIEGALAALIEGATGAGEGGVGGGATAPPAAAELDLSQELAALHSLAGRYGLMPDAVQALVVECRGDLSAAERVLHGQAAACGVPAPVAAADRSPALPPLAAEPPGLFEPAATAWAAATPGGSGGGGGGGWDSLGTAVAPLGLGAGSCPSSSFSAFGFSGFTQAALQAVRGPAPAPAPAPTPTPSSLFSSADSAGGLAGLGAGTPAGQDRLVPASASGLWSDAPSPSPHSTLALAAAAAAPSHAAEVASLFGGGGLAAEGATASPFDKLPPQQQAAFAAAVSAWDAQLPAAGSVGAGGSSLWGGGLPVGGGSGSWGQPLEESELNALISQLGCGGR